jgi:hypothetical protein
MHAQNMANARHINAEIKHLIQTKVCCYLGILKHKPVIPWLLIMPASLSQTWSLVPADRTGQLLTVL